MRSVLACLYLQSTAAAFYCPNTAFEQWSAETQLSCAIQQMLLFKSHKQKVDRFSLIC